MKKIAIFCLLICSSEFKIYGMRNRRLAVGNDSRADETRNRLQERILAKGDPEAKQRTLSLRKEIRATNAKMTEDVLGHENVRSAPAVTVQVTQTGTGVYSKKDLKQMQGHN